MPSEEAVTEEKTWYHFTANGHSGLTLLTPTRAAELAERYEVVPWDEIPDTDAIIVPILKILINRRRIHRV